MEQGTAYDTPTLQLAEATAELYIPPGEPSLDDLRHLLRDGVIALEGGARQLAPLIEPQRASLLHTPAVAAAAQEAPEEIRDTALTTIAKGLLRYGQYLQEEPPNAASMAAEYLGQIARATQLSPNIRSPALIHHSLSDIHDLFDYAAKTFPTITPVIVSRCLTFNIADPKSMLQTVASRMEYVRAVYTADQLSNRDLQRVCLAGKNVSHETVLSRAAMQVEDRTAIKAQQQIDAAVRRQTAYEQRLADGRTTRATLRAERIAVRSLQATRAEVIPRGDCVDDNTAKELFARLDAGDTTTTLPAIDTCLDCKQLSVCQNRLTEAAGPILNSGVAKTVVGGIEWSNGAELDTFPLLEGIRSSLRHGVFNAERQTLDRADASAAARQRQRVIELLTDHPLSVQLGDQWPRAVATIATALSRYDCFVSGDLLDNPQRILQEAAEPYFHDVLYCLKQGLPAPAVLALHNSAKNLDIFFSSLESYRHHYPIDARTERQILQDFPHNLMEGLQQYIDTFRHLGNLAARTLREQQQEEGSPGDSPDYLAGRALLRDMQVAFRCHTAHLHFVAPPSFVHFFTGPVCETTGLSPDMPSARELTAKISRMFYAYGKYTGHDYLADPAQSIQAALQFIRDVQDLREMGVDDPVRCAPYHNPAAITDLFSFCEGRIPEQVAAMSVVNKALFCNIRDPYTPILRGIERYPIFRQLPDGQIFGNTLAFLNCMDRRAGIPAEKILNDLLQFYSTYNRDGRAVVAFSPELWDIADFAPKSRERLRRALLAGDEVAYLALDRSFRRDMRRAAVRRLDGRQIHLADDAVQLAFIRLWKDRYKHLADPRRPIESTLFAFVKYALQRLRKQTEQSLPFSAGPLLETGEGQWETTLSDPVAVTDLENVENRILLAQMMDQAGLTNTERVIIRLHSHRFSPADIGAAVLLPVSEIETQLRILPQRLRAAARSAYP